MVASTDIHQISFIPFDQSSDIISKLDFINHKKLRDIKSKYNGLCELICNRILIDNSLGCGVDENYLKNRVTIERLNEEKIINSHLLEVYSIFQRVIAYLFGIFPDNIFSFWDQWKLIARTGSVNREILKNGLDTIENGTVLKLEVFEVGCFKFVGHSMLVKKIESENYIFFNPDHGEYRNLSFSELCNKIDEQLTVQQGTNIFVTKGSDYLNRL